MALTVIRLSSWLQVLSSVRRHGLYVFTLQHSETQSCLGSGILILDLCHLDRSDCSPCSYMDVVAINPLG